MPDSPPSIYPLPVVITIGFAGSRHLLPSPCALTEDEQGEFHNAVQAELEKRVQGLHQELPLAPHHFLCGLSQIAIGGDTLFIRACGALPIPQRIFLSQTLDEYLDAKSSTGIPDFSPAEKATALELVAGPHIIHTQVVSDSHDRTARFEDTNLEILRTSDILICLVRSDADGKAGGTLDVLQDAVLLGRPVLEIRVAAEGARPVFTSTWHRSEEPWKAPALPAGLAGANFSQQSPKLPGVPMDSSQYLTILKGLGSRLANWQRTVFKIIAMIVIGAHLLATCCAVFGLMTHHSGTAESGDLLLPLLLGMEILLLVAGFWVHLLLHHSKTVKNWAISRLTAEIARSVSALRSMHVYLEYLFTLPFPKELLPLLRTINVLHLASSRSAPEDWKKKRARYLEDRLDRKGAQIAYYDKGLKIARYRTNLANRCFFFASSIAVIAALGELIAHYIPAFHGLKPVLGPLAILMPVLAVAAMSLAASFDLEARVHTYHDTLEFLTAIRPLFDAARSERAFIHLVLETESRLLGETANWASRRSFTSVA